jgi:hypothetical protein
LEDLKVGELKESISSNQEEMDSLAFTV